MSLFCIDSAPIISKKLAINMWADYIELICLMNTDKEISINDIISDDKQDNILQEEQLKEDIDGDEEYSENFEKKRLYYNEIFKYLKSRMIFLKEYYPFEIIDETILKRKNLDDEKYLYIYFLISSNTRYFIKKETSYAFTNFFEHISLLVMKIIYPNFDNHLFGTANKKGDLFYGGTLLDKLKTLSQCLGTNVILKTSENPHNLSGGGDKGLDIVSFYSLDHESTGIPYIPFSFCQCTCSYNTWKIKQNTIKPIFWINRFNDLPAYHEYMFVPFSFREINGKWSKSEIEEINTIVIDRFRFFHLIKIGNIEFTNILPDQVKSAIINILKGNDDV